MRYGLSLTELVVDEHLPYEGLELGTPAYGEGVEPAKAFSISEVMRWGIAGLQEYPLLVVLAGLNLVIVSILPQLLSAPIEMVMEFAPLPGELGEFEREGIKSVVQIMVGLVFLPFQQLIIAGAYVGLANAIRNGDSSISLLYLSIRPAVNALLYAVLATSIGLLVTICAISPVFALLATVLMMQLHVSMGLSFVVLIAFSGFFLLIAVPVSIYVSLGLQLGVYAAALDNRMPMDALRISWSMARGARSQLLLTNVVLGLLAMVGMCMCVLPSILVYGIQLVGLTAAWLRSTRSKKITDDWAFFEIADY